VGSFESKTQLAVFIQFVPSQLHKQVKTIILGNLKSVQSHANVNDLTYNHGTKVILASFSRFVGWMKTFAILDSIPKIIL
jgi:hypothetical protein